MYRENTAATGQGPLAYLPHREQMTSPPSQQSFIVGQDHSPTAFVFGTSGDLSLGEIDGEMEELDFPNS